MATLRATDPTLLDVAQRAGNESIRDMVEILAQWNPMLEDAPAIPMNKGLWHENAIRTGLPTPFWGRVYKGVPTSKGTVQMVRDTSGFLESASEVDERIVDDIESALGQATIRQDEAEAHMEAMGQEMARALIYSDSSTNPDRPTGLAPRFSSKTAENGKQIIDAGGTGSDNTSIWIVTWDKKTVHLLYPNKGKAGIERFNRNKINRQDANGDTFFVYREDFRWHMGLTVRDWRYVVRIANIDVSDLTTDAVSGANLINLMTEGYYKHYGRRTKVGKTFIYANTTIVKFLDYQARNVPKNLYLTLSQTGVNASEVLSFRGIAIHETDAILETEARVV